MRQILVQQQALVPRIDHPHARELEAISGTLDALPELAEAVHADLIRGLRNPRTGRRGLTAEQVVRTLILKQLKGFSYEQLQFELASSWVYQSFCRLDPNAPAPNRRTLQRNLSRVSAQTLQAIGHSVVRYAVEQGIDKGRKVRTDCTVEATNIHAPSDSSLLWDGVRVLTRLMHRAHKRVQFDFSDHTRRAKRRAKAILYGRTMQQRVPLYQDLLKVTRMTLSYLEPCLQALKCVQGTASNRAEAFAITQSLTRYRELTLRVIEQTERRVLFGESVPANEKIVSLFEPHTDIIRKDRRETYYGHKLCLTTGASGLVLDMQVLDGNPSDSTLAVQALKRVQATLGQMPRQASFDGGFASKENLEQLKGLGIHDVVFHKKCGLKISDMAKSAWVYRSLRRFRAGVESGISFLKRCFGIDCCTWKGLERFKAYTLASTLAHNLLLIARHQLA